MSLQQFMAMSPHHRRRLAISLSTSEKKAKKNAGEELVQTVKVATEIKRDQQPVDVWLNGHLFKQVLMDHGVAANIMMEEVALAIGIHSGMLAKMNVVCKGVNQQPLLVLGKAENVRIICGDISVKMSLTVVWIPNNPYPVILGQPWLECVDAYVMCRRGVLQLGPQEHHTELSLYPPSQMGAWCKQSDMEFISSEKRLVGSELARRSIRIQQLREEASEEEEEGNGWETEIEDYSSSDESLIMQIAIAPECVEEDFGAPESPVHDLEFETANREKKIAKVGMAMTEDEKQRLWALFSKFGHLFVTSMTQMPQRILGKHHIVLKEGAKPVQQKLRRIKP